MHQNVNKIPNKLALAIHSTDNSFGFACRIDNNNESDTFYIKEFDKNLCNNLVVDFNKFISKENLRKVKKISVSIGPANFNASRLIVVLARTISQQIRCPLASFSSYKLMSRRIALQNNIYKTKQSFWIYKELKRKGFLAGKYEVCLADEKSKKITIKEKILPKVIEELQNKVPNFKAQYDDREDLKELLTLSNENLEMSTLDSWEKVLPLYPLSPIN